MHADLWFKNAVVYSLNVETFLDANGDGCGDLEGLSRKLDYLDGLGVDTLWLAPFQPTPGRDDGYDITDTWGSTRGSAHPGTSSSSCTRPRAGGCG